MTWPARSGALVALLCVGAAPDVVAAPPGASSCSGCHSPAPGVGAVPHIAGLSADQIAGALMAFRSGERPATVMNRIAKGFSESESRAIAEWVAAGSRP